MELIDSHCHLYFTDFDADREEVLNRAREAGVRHMITIGIDSATSEAAIDLAKQYDCLSATVGHHPHDAAALRDEDLERLKVLAQDPVVVGFGEIGLDFYRDLSPRTVQMRRFDDLVQLGLELRLPLIIHDREAHLEVYELLSARDAGRHGGVIHCYSGDYQMARRFLDLGFYISIPGTITYPKAEALREVVAALPLDVLLVETDAPFLAPVPRRGRRNEPAHVRYTATEVAGIKGVDLEEAAQVTTDNARRLFSLSTESDSCRQID